MITNISHLNSFIFDEPVDYKGLKIYPVKLKDYNVFLFAVECLLVDKNSIPDAQIISMGYLDYLLSYGDEKNRYIQMLASLIYICMKVEPDNIKLNIENQKEYVLSVSGINIKTNDFEEIKSIILEQNLVDVPDYTIQKEIRDKIEEGKRLRSKINNSKPASFEDQMVSLSIATGISLDSIQNMTYRKFVKSIERMDLLIHYKIFLQSSMSGMVSFKDKSFIKHWLNNIDEKNSDMIELDVMKKKVSFEDKK
jgi:hypothetical protein